jgi:predicted  nucleic acid-binding Zn-ribbon protein
VDPAPAEPEEHPLKAAPHDQQRLLEVQALDARLDLLGYRRRTLPEHAELDKLDRELAEVRDRIVAAETERSDLERARDKADADVEQVRQRARRDQQRLDTGQVSSPRELQSLQSEIASLARRQSDLEDTELEVLQRLEDVDKHHVGLLTRRAELGVERDATAARRDASLRDIDAELADKTGQRADLVAQVDTALVDLYEKIRASSNGVGAAALLRRRCTGCQLELNATDLSRFRAAAPDEVLRCEECRRILVRTAESGL